MVSALPSLRDLPLIIPDRDYMLLVADESTPTTDLVLVGEAEKEFRDVWYEIIDIGPGRITPDGTLVPSHLKIGDRVLLMANPGPRELVKVQREGKTLLLLMCSSQYVMGTRHPEAPSDIRWSTVAKGW